MPNIKTYCRIKPTAETYEEHESTKTTLYLRVPEVLKDFASNQKGSRSFVSHEFNFDHIFLQEATQQDVFEVVAEKIVHAFLDGYNGTIFAYGQTGTGKTYTVEGSAKTYHSRGLEPRSLSMIYKELEKRTSEEVSVHISYIEIYQDIGYDLLNPGARTQSYVTPFPKVNVVEGPSGSIIVRNLSNHLAASEDVAQSLLLQGQANRKVAATAIHDRSSRSHAVFTIQLSAKKMDSDTVVRSKLHLVDLAGSERVAKTRVLGHQLSEAKKINLSLHHLESVIVALQEEALNIQRGQRARTSVGARRYTFSGRPSSADGVRTSRHVPYRNSLLTMLLRDSLGGNCMTAMIATVSLEISNLGESISTCRFAGRVACIANTVSRNEELDEKSLIRKLKKRIAELETELACLKLAQEGDGDIRMQLTEEDKMICSQVVNQYLSGKIADPVTAGITNPYKFRECLRILKKVVSRGLPMDANNNRQKSLDVILPQGHGQERRDEEEDNDVTVAMETLKRNNSQKLREERTPEGVAPNSVVTRPAPKAKASQNPQALRRTASFDVSRPPASAPVRSNLTGESTQEYAQSRRQAAEAWVDTTVESRGMSATTADRNTLDSRGTSATVGERTWTANSKKDPETLSQLLNDHSEKPRTPFEQKRVQEIKKINARVEKLHVERSEKEQEVMDMKIKVAEKELDLMERHMKTKLGVTTAQVQDQAAYVKQLETTEADHQLIGQEKLVEKQLRRRMERYESQLEYIDHRRTQLKNHKDGVVTMTESQMTSLQDKYGQFRKRDGSLNTRQVFQMLKSEERKQHKAKTYIEREKVIATANLMEMKELATRQRLRELKEAMAAGKPFVPYSIQNGEVNGHADPTTGASQKPVEDGDGEINQSLQSGCNQPNGTVPNNDFYTKKKAEKDPTSKWESSYSRPTTPSNLSFQNEGQRSGEGQGDLNDSRFRMSGKSEEKQDNEVSEKRKQILSEEDMLEIQSKRFEKEINNSRNRKTKERESDQRTYMPSEYVHGISKTDQFDARKMNLSAKNFDSALNSMLGQDNTKLVPNNTEYEQYARTSKYQPNPYLESQRPSRPRTRSQRGQRSGKQRQQDMGSAEKQRTEPDVVASPMSAKISRYLQDTPAKKREPKPRPRPSSAGLYGNDRYEPTAPWKEFGLGGKEGIDFQKLMLTSNLNTMNNSGMMVEIEDEPLTGRVVAMKEKEREQTYMSKAQVERNRVNRIRKARQSAEKIQRAWRRYRARKELEKRKKMMR